MLYTYNILFLIFLILNKTFTASSAFPSKYCKINEKMQPRGGCIFIILLTSLFYRNGFFCIFRKSRRSRQGKPQPRVCKGTYTRTDTE